MPQATKIRTTSSGTSAAISFQRPASDIAFYGSTRSYLPILSLHGLDELGLKLHAMSLAGRWHEMAAEVPDEVVHIFAACGRYDEIARAIEMRFGGLADSIELNFSTDTPAGL